MNKSIVILSFSGRKDGNCAKIAQFVSNYYDSNRVSSVVIDQDVVAPCGGCNCECLRQNQRCPQLTGSYRNLMDSICSCDLVYFIVPNYCGYPSANYFAFNERSVG